MGQTTAYELRKGYLVTNKEGQALKRKAVQKNDRMSAFGIEH